MTLEDLHASTRKEALFMANGLRYRLKDLDQQLHRCGKVTLHATFRSLDGTTEVTVLKEGLPGSVAENLPFTLV
jgi:hypothetical protein